MLVKYWEKINIKMVFFCIFKFFLLMQFKLLGFFKNKYIFNIVLFFKYK